MMSPSAAFSTANASLAKKPYWLMEILGYDSTTGAYAQGYDSAGQIFDPRFIVQIVQQQNAPGVSLYPDNVPIAAPQTGNILFAFLDSLTSTTTPIIRDSNGGVWTLAFSGTFMGDVAALWYRNVTPGEPAMTVYFDNAIRSQSLGSSNLTVLEIQGQSTGNMAIASNSGTSSTVSVTVGSHTYSFVPVVSAMSEWQCVVVQFPSSYVAGKTYALAFLSGPIGSSTQLDSSSQFGWLGCQIGTTYGTLGISQTGPFLKQKLNDIFSWGWAAQPWLVSIQDLKLTVSDLDGTSNLADLVFNLQDYGQAITAKFPSFVFEGKEVQFRHGFVGMQYFDLLQMFRGALNTIESDHGNTEYQLTVSSFNLKKLTTAVYTVGDDGFTTSSKHPKTLNAHPLDMLVSVLEQAGIAASDIDTAKIYFYRDTIFNGLSFTFTLTQAPTAKDFVEAEIMKPLGMYVWENASGLVSVNSFYPAMSGNGSYTPPTPPVVTLDGNTLTDVPVVAEADLVDQVIFRFDDDGTGNGKFLSEDVSTYVVAQSKYGLTDAHIIESKGMRSGLQGFFMSAIVARLIFLRYGLKNLVLDPQTMLWSACTLEPGDIIAVTSAYLPNRAAGTLGFTALTFEVLDRTWQFEKGLVQLKLLNINLAAFKQYLITPNGEANYTAASGTDQGKYMFLCGTNNEYSNSNPGNTLG